MELRRYFHLKNLYFNLIISLVITLLVISGMGCSSGEAGSGGGLVKTSGETGSGEINYYRDWDNDGYGDPETSLVSFTAPIGYVTDNSDCDDTNPDINPGAEETLDGQDNNCNGEVDEFFIPYYVDADHDGYGDINDTVGTKHASNPGVGWSLTNDDCDDTNPDINPDAQDVFDGIDNNCDGLIDVEIPVYYIDNDFDGYGDANDLVGKKSITDPGSGWSLINDDCDDTDPNVNPGAIEIVDGIDNNCDGLIDTEAEVWSWGWNYYGQLGNGASGTRLLALQVSGISNVIEISGGKDHTLALTSNGAVWAWGGNTYGELGNGSNDDKSTPTLTILTYGVTAIAAGKNHSIALKSNGTVWTWGNNFLGQLGNGTNDDSAVPVQVSDLTNIIAIATGERHNVALKNDGTVWTWGNNWEGQLGDGTNIMSNIPIQVTGLSDVTAIAAGSDHTMAIKNDGSLWAWGDNGKGQLGDGTDTDQYLPIAITSISGVIDIDGSCNHTVALKNDGTVWAWGWNGSGQLGDSTYSESFTPVQVTGLTNITKISAGGYVDINYTTAQSAALKDDGTVWTWGSNFAGQLGNNDETFTSSNVPVQVSGLTNATSVVCGQKHAMAIKNDATMWIWGDNFLGQLGDGTFANSETPVAASGLSNVLTIEAGMNHSAALLNDGTVWTWGHNAYGQLGDGTNINKLIPVQVTALANVTNIAIGKDFTLALINDGTVWTWGYNAYGQLGDGTADDSNVPVQVTGLTNVTDISAGHTHSMALKDDGTVWTWGHNENGQLGNGTSNDSMTPVQVIGLATNIIDIKGGRFFSLALKDDGTVWGWGHNQTGELGIGTTSDKYSPVQMQGLTNVIAITGGGGFHTLALKDDRTVWACGANNYGQLGDGTTVQRTLPVQVLGLTNVTAIAGGTFFNAVIKNDGTVWTWGQNHHGQLGDGLRKVDSKVPVRARWVAGATAIAAGEVHTVVLK